jgi:DNA-binding response OmpR family regulator
VLLVDDDELVRASIRTLLEKAGYVVHEAADGIAAFAAFDDDISLVITDNQMPGLLGTELAKRLRRQRRNVPVILITGSSSSDTSNVCAVIKKPFCPAEFVDTVRAYCG